MINSSPSSVAAEDHMEIMTMMMQMEKLPEFCDLNFHASNSSLHPEIQFSTSGNTLQQPIFQHPNTNINPTSCSSSSSTSSMLINLPTSTSFMANPVPETSISTHHLHHPSVPTSGKFRYGGLGPLFSNNANSYASSVEKKSSMAAMREMIFRIAAMQPIHIDPESIKPPKRRNVRISKDPQSVAARHRRERISERIRILQRLVPGGTKMDTASMLDEAIHYVKFLKRQVQSLEQVAANRPMGSGLGLSGATLATNMGYSPLVKACQPSNSAHYHHQAMGNIQMLR